MIRPAEPASDLDDPALLQLQISLDDIEPRIWRRVVVSSDLTLHGLHRMIQMLFDWYGYHLYRFDFEDEVFEAPIDDAQGSDSTQVTLQDLEVSPGSLLEYEYDFGDGWLHTIEVEELTAEPQRGWVPWVVDGERRGPPEDSGGPYMYPGLLRALEKDPAELEDWEREKIEWFGEGFDPNEFSLVQARHSVLLAAVWGLLDDE